MEMISQDQMYVKKLRETWIFESKEKIADLKVVFRISFLILFQSKNGQNLQTKSFL